MWFLSTIILLLNFSLSLLTISSTYLVEIIGYWLFLHWHLQFKLDLYKHLRFFLMVIVCLICMQSSSQGFGSLCWIQVQLSLKENSASVIKQELFPLSQLFSFFSSILTQMRKSETLGVGESLGFRTLLRMNIHSPILFAWSGQTINQYFQK